MSLPGTQLAQRGMRRFSVGKYFLATFALIALLFVVSDNAAASSPALRSASFSGYSNLLINQSSRSLYVLSVEKGAHVKCSSHTCLSIWPPMLVKKSVMSISLGAKVKGKIGFIARSTTMKQVTFNSYPLYTYSGDKGSKETHGQGIAADGGTWHLVRATATATSQTFAKRSNTSTTTTTSGGGYGY